MDLSNYITVKQYAENQSHSEHWIRILCREGKIKGAVRIGRCWFIPAKLIDPEQAMQQLGLSLEM